MNPDTIENHLVRAVLLTQDSKILLVQHQQPGLAPYWVAPGGGVRDGETPEEALHRELAEDLGATALILQAAFTIDLRPLMVETFYICRLQSFDFSRRSAPETRPSGTGDFTQPETLALTCDSLEPRAIKPTELKEYLLKRCL